MTQPEETTAAKKAAVNINIMDAPQVERALSDAAAMVAWARAERNEQRARAEKAEAELAKRPDFYDLGALNARLLARTNERDDARTQLAAIEWASLRKDNHGGPLSACCPICQGVKPGHEVGSRFAPGQVGHRPDCWFAKKGIQATLPAGTLKVGDTVSVRVSFRGYAIGMKPETVDTTKDAVLSATATKSEPARPEPRFKVGEKVVWEESQTSQREGHVESIGNGAYLVRSRSGHLFSWAEDRLKPAPKFAVGEWVEAKGVTGPVIARHWERSRANTWSYDVQTPRWVRLLYEFELTAQTPQHKHDCEGCVFLGRWNRFDLYVCANGKKPIGYRYGDHALDLGWDEQSEAGVEARRRAVARGLV
jgi:hypothetical protein